MSGQDDSAGLVTGDLTDDSPHEAASFRVHTSRRLIEQDDRWATNDGNGDGQLSLVASGECTSHLLSVICQVELLNGTFNKLCSTFGRNSLDPSKVLDILFDRHVLKYEVMLWAVANKLLDVFEIFADVVCTDVDGAHGRLDLGGQALEGRGFTGTIDSK